MAQSKLVLWSAQVKARDGKCMECGVLDNLHAHHVLPKSTHPELKFDVSNGRTLCYSCHKKWHEDNRPPRVRSGRPQRKTLEKYIAHLESENRELTKVVRRLELLNKKCERGHCNIAMQRYAKLKQYGL